MSRKEKREARKRMRELYLYPLKAKANDLALDLILGKEPSLPEGLALALFTSLAKEPAPLEALLQAGAEAGKDALRLLPLIPPPEVPFRAPPAGFSFLKEALAVLRAKGDSEVFLGYTQTAHFAPLYRALLAWRAFERFGNDLPRLREVLKRLDRLAELEARPPFRPYVLGRKYA